MDETDSESHENIVAQINTNHAHVDPNSLRKFESGNAITESLNFESRLNESQVNSSQFDSRLKDHDIKSNFSRDLKAINHPSNLSIHKLLFKCTQRWSMSKEWSSFNFWYHFTRDRRVLRLKTWRATEFQVKRYGYFFSINAIKIVLNRNNPQTSSSQVVFF